MKRVTVRDVESGQSYYFLCEQWLAVEESDGKVEREFMALDSHIGFGVVRVIVFIYCCMNYLHCNGSRFPYEIWCGTCHCVYLLLHELPAL